MRAEAGLALALTGRLGTEARVHPSTLNSGRDGKVLTAFLVPSSPWAPEAFNCSAPDTGNMEVLVRYGTPRAAGALARAASRRGDPLRLCDDRARRRLVRRDEHRARIERDGGDYVINGRKWWTSGARDPRCKILILMGGRSPAAADRTSGSR